MVRFDWLMHGLNTLRSWRHLGGVTEVQLPKSGNEPEKAIVFFQGLNWTIGLKWQYQPHLNGIAFKLLFVILTLKDLLCSFEMEDDCTGQMKP